MEWIDVDHVPAARAGSPLGWFIHALTEITISDPVKPVITTGIALSMWARGESRSQP